MSKVKATRRPKRSAAKSAYFVVRGRRVRIDEVLLVIPQANGSDVHLLVDVAEIRYSGFNADGQHVTATYEHETLTPALG